MSKPSDSKTLVFTGAYADTTETGIGVYAFDTETGALQLLDEISGVKNPTFLSVNPQQRKLYAIGEDSKDGSKSGEVVTFDIDIYAGKLKEKSRVYAGSNSLCHIQSNPDRSELIVCSYHGGFNAAVAVSEEGDALKLKSEHSHTPYREREDQQPKAHSAFVSPDRRYIFVQDLGLDKLIAYRNDTRHPESPLSFHGETKVAPGAGPRHLAFHPSGKYAYVINELSSTITVFRYSADTGFLETIHTVSTLPADYTGENGCAEIAVSEDGQTLYGSNRGHDSIAVFSIDQMTGHITPIQYISTEGGHPRHFTLMPGGKFLYAANRDDNNLVLFRVQPEDGTLAYTGYTIKQSKPVCVKPAVFTI